MLVQTQQSFIRFLEAVRNSGCFGDNVGPPVVHCKSGIGRSVTFALIDSALAISEEKDISLQDVKSLLLKLRSQRSIRLVESSEQFKFAISILVANSQFNQSASIASPGNSDVLAVKGKPDDADSE